MDTSSTSAYAQAKQRLAVARLAYDAGDFHAALRHIRLVFAYLSENPSAFSQREWSMSHHLAGKINLDLKNLPKAREHFSTALELKTADTAFTEKLSDMRHLAECFRHEKNFLESERMFKECIEQWKLNKDQYGESEVDYAKSAMGLARLYLDCGRIAEAEETLNSCIEKLELCGPNTRFWFGRCLLTKARLTYARGNIEEAEQILKRGLSVVEPLVGPSHPLCTRSMQGLAKLHLLMGHNDSAKSELAVVAELNKLLSDQDR